MAFKSINHDDEKIFYNRLWKLMEERNLSTARELAQALYAEEIVPVDSASEDEISIIGSMTRRIQEHLNLEGTDKLQGRYVKAYCDFFGCSADYLFGLLVGSAVDICRPFLYTVHVVSGSLQFQFTTKK